MLIKTVRFTRKVIIFFVSVLFLVSLFYSTLVTRSPGPFVPPTVLRPASTSNSSSFKKVSLAYYTTFYGSRKDSQSNLFNADLNQICTSLDPEEYSNADGVVVSMVDFVRFPVLVEPNESYRRKYASQLWLLHVEESPRNSYRTVETRNVSDLDDWFNLTASLKPESDLHIQYNVRIHREIKAGTFFFHSRDTESNRKSLFSFKRNSMLLWTRRGIRLHYLRFLHFRMQPPRHISTHWPRWYNEC